MFAFPTQMLKVFKDEAIQQQFEKDGYVVLPFYTEAEMEELNQLYYRLHPKSETGFFPSTFSQDKNYRTEADREIRRICDRPMEHYLENIKTVLGAFIAKTPGPESGMCVHQDMSLVDESRYTGINIWVPLCDLTVQNGTLFVLPGSHRQFPTYRGSSIPEFFEKVNDAMIDYLQPVIIKAGEAVFFDQSIIHFSPPNYTNDIRIVTNTYFTHKEAEFRTYFYDKNSALQSVEEFEQNDSFMTDFEQFGANIHDRPKVGKSLGMVDYDFPSINSEYLEKHFTRTHARQLIADAVPKLETEETHSPKEKNIFQRMLDLVR